MERRDHRFSPEVAARVDGDGELGARAVRTGIGKLDDDRRKVVPTATGEREFSQLFLALREISGRRVASAQQR